MRVDFGPKRGGSFRNRLIVRSADLVPSRREVVLTGQGLAPLAAISPLPEVGLRFAGLEIGQKSALPLTLINQGSGRLLVEEVEISGLR